MFLIFVTLGSSNEPLLGSCCVGLGCIVCRTFSLHGFLICDQLFQPFVVVKYCSHLKLIVFSIYCIFGRRRLCRPAIRMCCAYWYLASNRSPCIVSLIVHPLCACPPARAHKCLCAFVSVSVCAGDARSVEWCTVAVIDNKWWTICVWGCVALPFESIASLTGWGYGVDVLTAGPLCVTGPEVGRPLA